MEGFVASDITTIGTRAVDPRRMIGGDGPVLKRDGTIDMAATFDLMLNAVADIKSSMRTMEKDMKVYFSVAAETQQRRKNVLQQMKVVIEEELGNEMVKMNSDRGTNQISDADVNIEQKLNEVAIEQKEHKMFDEMPEPKSMLLCVAVMEKINDNADSFINEGDTEKLIAKVCDLVELALIHPRFQSTGEEDPDLKPLAAAQQIGTNVVWMFDPGIKSEKAERKNTDFEEVTRASKVLSWELTYLDRKQPKQRVLRPYVLVARISAKQLASFASYETKLEAMRQSNIQKLIEKAIEDESEQVFTLDFHLYVICAIALSQVRIGMSELGEESDCSIQPHGKESYEGGLILNLAQLRGVSDGVKKTHCSVAAHKLFLSDPHIQGKTCIMIALTGNCLQELLEPHMKSEGVVTYTKQGENWFSFISCQYIYDMLLDFDTQMIGLLITQEHRDYANIERVCDMLVWCGENECDNALDMNFVSLLDFVLALGKKNSEEESTYLVRCFNLRGGRSFTIVGIPTMFIKCVSIQFYIENEMDVIWNMEKPTTSLVLYVMLWIINNLVPTFDISPFRTVSSIMQHIMKRWKNSIGCLFELLLLDYDLELLVARECAAAMLKHIWNSTLCDGSVKAVKMVMLARVSCSNVAMFLVTNGILNCIARNLSYILEVQIAVVNVLFQSSHMSREDTTFSRAEYYHVPRPKFD